MEAQRQNYNIDSYLEWVQQEGLKVAEGFAIDLFAVDLGIWPRFGIKGAAVHCAGRGDYSNMFVMELPPGGSAAPQRHLYEEVCYCLEGSGATQVEFSDGTKRSFEWGERSLFAIPLNTKYRHFNGSGITRSLLVSTTDLPLMMNAFHNERFIFDNDFDFMRTGKQSYYSGEGDLITVRQGNHMWETNFVPDLGAMDLLEWGDRGAGGSNIMFVLADGIMHAHISEVPVGTYKKAHRHIPGYHVMCINGDGYSLLWFEGDKDFLRVDWKHGTVFPPADQQFHQHFNSSSKPARYLATGTGGLRYPFTAMLRRAFWGLKPGEIGAVSRSIKEGGDQVEYVDQDPRIHKIWLEEMAKNGVQPRMHEWFPENTDRPL